jgi:hypothetical protein
MGSPMPDDEAFGTEEQGFDDMPDDMGGEPSSEKPFDDEPFDAGVEANEEDNPEKYIQQLSGKLGQSLRKHAEETGQPDFDLEKFAINSVLSATNSGSMDQEDQSDIIAKVKSSSTIDGANDGANDGAEPDVSAELGDMGEEPNDNPEGMDLSNIEMEESVIPKKNTDDLLNKKVYVANRKETGIVKKIDGNDVIVQMKSKEMVNVTLADVKEVTEVIEHNPNFGGKTVFADPSLGVKEEGMEENKYLNLENTKKRSNIVDKLKINKMLKESLELGIGGNTVEPQVEPQVIPKTKPMRETRRNKPYRIIPEQLPNPKPKANSPMISYIKDSGFSTDTNSVTIIFDVEGEPNRFTANFVCHGRENNDALVKPEAYDESWVFPYTTDILENGKQYFVAVSFGGNPLAGFDLEGFVDGKIPEIEEV